MRFDLVDLRLFLRVAEARSITRGAERTNLALASASERIRGMEEALGVALLTRGRRGVALTAAGQCLESHARLVVHQVDEMRGELAGFARGLKGRVQLLSNTAAMSLHLPDLLASFLAQNPDTDIDLEERESADVVEAIAAARADIGIASDAAKSESVSQYPFRDDRLVLIVPRRDRLARAATVSFHEVASHDFVGLARDSALQRHLDGHAARLGARLRLRVRVGSFDDVCRMVAAGVGIAVVPDTAAERGRHLAGIERIALRDPWASRRLVLCIHRQRRLTAPARRLFAHLRALAKTMA